MSLQAILKSQYHASLAMLLEAIDTAVDRLDLTAPTSGFSWYQMPKLEHQLLNLRHLHHHTGQLADRLRQVTGRGIRWVGGTPAR